MTEVPRANCELLKTQVPAMEQQSPLVQEGIDLLKVQKPFPTTEGNSAAVYLAQCQIKLHGDPTAFPINLKDNGPQVGGEIHADYGDGSVAPPSAIAGGGDPTVAVSHDMKDRVGAKAAPPREIHLGGGPEKAPPRMIGAGGDPTVAMPRDMEIRTGPQAAPRFDR